MTVRRIGPDQHDQEHRDNGCFLWDLEPLPSVVTAWRQFMGNHYLLLGRSFVAEHLQSMIGSASKSATMSRARQNGFAAHRFPIRRAGAGLNNQHKACVNVENSDLNPVPSCWSAMRYFPGWSSGWPGDRFQ